VAALQLYVNQAAMAYENVQEEARQQSLRRVADALASATELSQVRAQILASTRDLLGAEAVIFGFFDHDNRSFVRRFSDAAGLDQQLWGQYRALSLAPHSTANRLVERGLSFLSDVTAPAASELLGAASRELLQNTGVASLLSIPLQDEGKRLGLVCALYRQPRSFDEKTQRTAASFARYTSLALKKAKLVEQVRKANEAATAVTKITVLGQRQATLAALVKEMRKVTDGDAIVLFEYDQEKERLLSPITSGLNYPERALAEEPNSPLVRRLLTTSEPLGVEQVATHPDFKERSFAKDEGIQSFIAVALQAAGKRVGVLFVNYRKLRHFTAEEVETVQLFANQAALAIHYAQTTEANQRKLNELEALERLSSRLRQAQSLQEMMNCTTALAAQELGVECCNLILPDRNGRLHLRAQYGWQPPLEPFHLNPGTGSLAGFMIQTGEAVRVADYETKTRFTVVEHLRERGVKSGLSVPMFRDRQIVGALLALRRARGAEAGRPRALAGDRKHDAARLCGGVARHGSRPRHPAGSAGKTFYRQN
jgi:GAF domain-containing protein